jgi:hypothetical protein
VHNSSKLHAFIVELYGAQLETAGIRLTRLDVAPRDTSAG